MAITDLDEQLLVRAHQAGDEHAFGQIVRSQHRALYAHAYRRLGNHEAAEDAVQDTLLRAYRALPSFDGDLRLRAWLHRILTNVCHDESKRRQRQSGLIDRLEAEPFELAPDPIDEAVLQDTVRVMSGALAELPESYREALVLRYVDGLSFREVAAATGISEENARARVHRGRLALHKVLSRVAVMLAFLIPGVRRTHTTPVDGIAATSSEPTVSLATQLTSHAFNAAPTFSRVAELAASTSGAKSTAVAAVAAAVVAVAAPVAAYRVYDTTKTPERRPAAVAAPAAEHPDAIAPAAAGAAATEAAAATEPSTSTSTSSSSTLPPSAARPFETTVVPGDQATTDPAPTTTTSPPTTAPSVDDGGETVEVTIGGSAFAVTGARPDFEISGPVTMQGGSQPTSGSLAGRFYVADAVGGEASAELSFVLDDGSQYRVRFRGTLDGDEPGSSGRTWTMSGGYSVPGGEAIGLPEMGYANVVFVAADGGQSSLSFDLKGQHHT